MMAILIYLTFYCFTLRCLFSIKTVTVWYLVCAAQCVPLRLAFGPSLLFVCHLVIRNLIQVNLGGVCHIQTAAVHDTPLLHACSMYSIGIVVKYS